MVEKATGAITGPVTAEQFATANDLGSATLEAHAASHAAAGSDPVALAQSQITNLTTDLAAKAAAADLTSHTSNVSNPHSVTKAQVGLSNVDNTSDANKPVSTAQATADAAVATAASSALTTHTSNTSNPHSVTKAQVGLGSVDNTSDAAKPISTLTQAALDLKAPLASPALSGTPTAPTAAVATDNTQIATTGFVHDAIAEIPPGAAPDAEDIAIADAGDRFVGTTVEAALQESAGAIAALQNVSQPSATGNQLISGGGVALTGNLSVLVAPATYVIQGVEYTSAQTPLTADTADGSNPRYDVIALNTSGAAVIITGTPAASPVKPDVDPTTQLELTFISVPATATEIESNTVIVYDENDDDTMSQSGGHHNLASTNNPNNGTKDIEGTAVVANDYFQAQAASPRDLGNYDSLTFAIRNKAAWPSAKQLTITARLNGVQVGTAVTFKNGTFGFNAATNFTTYQQIVIPTAAFSAAGQAINQLRWTCQGGGGSIGYYVDDITLQSGVAQTSDATRMKPRGEWDAGLFYNLNDGVTSSGILYIAKRSNINKTPATSADDWKPYTAGGVSAADGVTYDNTTSGLAATDVQAAIDEVAALPGGGADILEVQVFS